MHRVATYMRVKPGCEEEYVRRHAAAWPDLLAGITGYGIRNYTIFIHGCELFSYFEADDLDAAMAQAVADPVNQRWQAYMAPIMDVSSGYQENTTVYLDEVFHIG